MAKLIQICASENDLFGLDAEGAVFHYNFNTDSWMRLGDGQRDDGVSRVGESRRRGDSETVGGDSGPHAVAGPANRRDGR